MDPIEITLPKSAPGVAALIGAWEDGGVYPVTITQVKSDGDSVVLSVVSDEVETESAPEAPPAPKSPSVKVKYSES